MMDSISNLTWIIIIQCTFIHIWLLQIRNELRKIRKGDG